ncbi:TonB-dependent receptor [Polynucleobacter sp. AP-Kolm-20A-A1]|uniref:TonB-dependent receptor n=1 Tax=Polynucleobacter sp. AP-Kolm-20A-A1 TaxID=2081041 RepID=UPI001BFDE7A1|nr:TonB-dependent receptor [Polynucleobacter sp. AP-Kolm-20A-A1]QWE20078.1 TonB-dependent receptor [Polynucleobacter sp. AP-Kolm-20A-A1]
MLFQQKKISACLGMIFGSAFVAIGVQAQIAPPPDYNQKLSEVVVNASRSDTPLDRMTMNTTVMTPEVLELAPEQTPDQILKNTPSVFLNDTPYYEKDPTGQSINMRGLGNARSLVLIDGVPALDPFYNTVQWNQVPMSSIESIEIVRGGVSSLWGNYGMGGVININTKNISNSKNEASVSYGSFGTGNVAVSKDLAVSDAMKLRFSADYFSTDGYVGPATISPATLWGVTKTLPNVATAQQAPLAPGMSNGSASNSNMRMQGNMKFSQDTDGFFRMGYSTMADLSSNYSFATNLVQTTNIAGGTTTKLDLDKKVTVSGFYQNEIFNKQNGATTNPPPAVKLTPANTPYISSTYQDPSTTGGGSVSLTHDLKNSLIEQYVVGVDLRQVNASNFANSLATTNCSGTGSNKCTAGTPSTQALGQTNVGVAYAKATQNFSGLMGQIKTNSQVPLQATLSARVDQYTSNVPEYYVAGANGANPTYTNAQVVKQTKLSPNLGLLYQLTDKWNLRGAAYQAFHAPGMNNMLRSYGSPGKTFSFANPNLMPENMTGYEVGTDYRWGAGFVQLTGFNNNITNAIYAATLSQGSAAYLAFCPAGSVCNGSSANSYSNNQNLQSQGLEFQAHHDINSKWATDATYTYTRAFVTWNASSVDAALNPLRTQLGGTPQNMGYASLTYYPLPKASLTANIRYIGNSWMDPAHSLPVPAYAVVGMRANYEVNQQVSLYASVVNLFNRQYITYGSGTSQASYMMGMPQAITVGAKATF